MNINNTPALPTINLHQEIARLDKEIEEIKFVQQFFEYMERPRKIYNFTFGAFLGVIYWTAIGERFFKSDTEKVVAIAIFFLAAAAYCLTVKYSPDMYQNFSRVVLNLI